MENVFLIPNPNLNPKPNLTLNLTSDISKYFSENDFQRDLPLVDVGLRFPVRPRGKFKVDSVYLFGLFSSGFPFGFYDGSTRSCNFLDVCV